MDFFWKKSKNWLQEQILYNIFLMKHPNCLQNKTFKTLIQMGWTIALNVDEDILYETFFNFLFQAYLAM